MPTLTPTADSLEPFYNGAKSSSLNFYVKCDSPSDLYDIQYSNGTTQDSKTTYNCANGSLSSNKSHSLGFSSPSTRDDNNLQVINLPVTSGDVAQDFTVTYKKRSKTVTSKSAVAKFHYYPFLGEPTVKGITGAEDSTPDQWLVLSGRTPVVHINPTDGAQDYSVSIFDETGENELCGPFFVKSNVTTSLTECDLDQYGNYLVKATAFNYNLVKVATSFGFGVDDWSATVPQGTISGIQGGVDTSTDSVLEDGPNPSLLWKSVEGATDYELYFSEDPNLTDPKSAGLTPFEYNSTPKTLTDPPTNVVTESLTTTAIRSATSAARSAVSTMKSLFSFETGAVTQIGGNECTLSQIPIPVPLSDSGRNLATKERTVPSFELPTFGPNQRLMSVIAPGASWTQNYIRLTVRYRPSENAPSETFEFGNRFSFTGHPEVEAIENITIASETNLTSLSYEVQTCSTPVTEPEFVPAIPLPSGCTLETSEEIVSSPVDRTRDFDVQVRDTETESIVGIRFGQVGVNGVRDTVKRAGIFRFGESISPINFQVQPNSLEYQKFDVRGIFLVGIRTFNIDTSLTAQYKYFKCPKEPIVVVTPTATPRPTPTLKGDKPGEERSVFVEAGLENKKTYFAYLVAKSRSGQIRAPIAAPYPFTVNFPNPTPAFADGVCGETTNNSRPTWSWSVGQWSNGALGYGTFKFKLDDSDLSTASESNATSFTPSTDLTPGEHTLYISGLNPYQTAYSDVVVCKKTITGGGNEVLEPGSPTPTASPTATPDLSLGTPPPSRPPPTPPGHTSETPPGTFAVSGVTGANDKIANDVLYSGLVPTITWGTSADAATYSIVIKNNLGATVCSSTAVAPTTTMTLATCTLMDNFNYTATVTAISEKGTISIPSSNSPFSFAVRAVPPPTGSNSLAVTDMYSCAIRSGKVFCWGDSTYDINPVNGQLELTGGYGYKPHEVSGLDGAVMISANKGSELSLPLGQVGYAIVGSELKQFDTNGSSTYFSSGVTFVSAADSAACAVVEGGVKCWGAIPDPGITRDATQVVAGNGHACAIFTNGGVKCWGAGTEGQLGDGLKLSSNTPVQPVGLTSSVKSLGLGKGISCAIMNPFGELKCWGWLAVNGVEENHPTPVTYLGFETGTQSVFGGAVHGCSVRAGDAYCVGFNASGQLGYSNGVTQRVAQMVPGLPSGSVSELALSYSHTCALAQGNVYCWGSNKLHKTGNAPGVVTPATTKILIEFEGVPTPPPATPTPTPTPIPASINGVTGGSGGSADTVVDSLHTAGGRNSPVIHWDAFAGTTNYAVRIYDGSTTFCTRNYATNNRTVSCSGLENFKSYYIEIKATHPGGTYTYPLFRYRIQM